MIESEIDRRIDALAEYLDLSPARIEYTGDSKDIPDMTDTYRVDGIYEEYYVMTDAEAEVAARDEAESRAEYALDWCSIDFLRDFLDEDWFEEAHRERCASYVECLAAYELIRECLNAGIIDEEDIGGDGEYIGDLDLEDEYIDYLFDEWSSGDYIEDFIDEYGERHFNKLISDGTIWLDTDSLADALIQSQSRGDLLSAYDGREIESGDYYIYRI